MTLTTNLGPNDTYVGRYWNDDENDPAMLRVSGGRVEDITSATALSVRDIFELADPLAHVIAATSAPVAPSQLLAPCDLRAIKACGVTFAKSMLERVIEERAGGNPSLASALRDELADAIGGAIATLTPGSEAAERVKQTLIDKITWSQYLRLPSTPTPRFSPRPDPCLP